MDDFWSGRRVLLTGGGGFLGGTLRRALEARGAKEIFVPRSAEYDLTRLPDTARLFSDTKPDLVIHLAARVGGIGYNQARPADLYLSNLLMGTYVIETARANDVEKTVILGTICSYPKFTEVPFREETLWDGYPEETNAPYGIAKKALLAHAEANHAQYGQRIIYLLPVNLYGPRDKFNPAVSHVIPALIKKFVDAQDAGRSTVEVWGTGAATREFLYVDDAAEGIVLGSELYDEPGPVNLGSGKEISIKDLAEMIASLTGYKGELVWDRTKPDGQPRRSLDTSRARAAFGFEAKTPLAEGLRTTIDWYRSHREEAEAVSG